MAERGDFFSKLKGLCQQLDKQIPQLNSQLKERKTTDKDRYDRTVLLKDLNVAVDKMNKEADELLETISCDESHFARVLQLAQAVVKQNQRHLIGVQDHLQKYGYVPPTTAPPVAETPSSSSDVMEENPLAIQKPGTLTPQVHKGPWTQDRTPTLEDFGLSEDYLEELDNKVTRDTLGCGDQAENAPIPTACGGSIAQTPADFIGGDAFVTPGVFDGRIVDGSTGGNLGTSPALRPAKTNTKEPGLEPQHRGLQNPQTPLQPILSLTTHVSLHKSPTASESHPAPRFSALTTKTVSFKPSTPERNRTILQLGDTPKTPEFLKGLGNESADVSIKNTGSYPVVETHPKTPMQKITYNKNLADTPETPQFVKNIGENQAFTGHGSSLKPPGGSTVKRFRIRGGLTPLDRMAPYVTPGKENMTFYQEPTMNFSGIQAEFNLIVEPVSEDEYALLPNFLRRQFTINTLNNVIDKLNALLENKLAAGLEPDLTEEELAKELGAQTRLLLVPLMRLERIHQSEVQGQAVFTIS